jgi:hypothetical protein
MKTKNIISLLLLLVVIPVFNVSAQKADFNGEWKLNKEKSKVPDNQLFLSKITIQLKPDSLLTTRTYENANSEEYPFDEKISLDGKENKITIYDMPRTSTATLSDSDGSLSITSTTEFNNNGGQADYTAKETWKVGSDGKTLTLQFTNKMDTEETTGTYTYDKTK